MDDVVRNNRTLAAPIAVAPLARFLERCHAGFAADSSGAVADYIPELSKANPAHFGVSVATIDGHVYDVGDSAIPFTIQSISKAFVFSLALETVGAEGVERKIGVEPSGEAFNSIRLTADNRPFNAMVNAGAIACSGLIYSVQRDGAFEFILNSLSRFAGRDLAVDETVFRSERATGDRNRAIAYMLRNYSVIEDDVDAVLDVYFRQCSILVTAHDLAVMAATLANRGVNPLTGERVITPYSVSRTLSVMTSSGMYDYAGEWVYRVGIPAKSGVGGGIIAALPAQFGLGTFSPLLDSHGNSVRGLKVCEALSSSFDLHVLNRTADVRTCVIADYDGRNLSSRRGRQPHEQQILDSHTQNIRVLELVGALTFATVDYVSRRLMDAPRPELMIIDVRRVPSITQGAAQLLCDSLTDLSAMNVTPVLSGIARDGAVREVLGPELKALAGVRSFELLDEAIEWAEDQVIYRYGGFANLRDETPLEEQALLAGLTPEELDEVAALSTARTYHTGERIVAAGDPATSIFFLRSGMVSVKLPSGIRLASLAQGMEFGEMSLIEDYRTADVWADTHVVCLEMGLDQFDEFCELNPRTGQRIVRNLVVLLAKRLILANTKVGLLSAY